MTLRVIQCYTDHVGSRVLRNLLPTRNSKLWNSIR